VIYNAQRVLNVLALFSFVRATNAVIVVGVLRSGGDTLFSFFLDGVVIWVVGVPMAFLGAFVLGLPVYGVYFMIMSEETLKFVLGCGATSPDAGSMIWRRRSEWLWLSNPARAAQRSRGWRVRESAPASSPVKGSDSSASTRLLAK